MPPKVSILLPNLNNRPFLPERMASILGQTFSDWELIVVDNYSSDGAWEFFQEWAPKDPRIHISQAPPQGMYDNWNNCIRLAQGSYVYIATSDDTMSPRFLEVMVQALEDHPECDLAHCKLKIIDDRGDFYQALPWDRFYGTVYFGDLINHRHIRLAPHDGLLHCGVRTVYTSITQLLIRRILFDRIGLFLTEYGSTADFEWGMRASLLAHTIHIPEYLAAWRVHPGQGTDLDALYSESHLTRLLELVDRAFHRAKKIDPSRLKRIKIGHLKRLYLRQRLQAEVTARRQKGGGLSGWIKFRIGLKWARISPGTLLEIYRYSRSKNRIPYFRSNLFDPLAFSKELLSRYGYAGNLKVLN